MLNYQREAWKKLKWSVILCRIYIYIFGTSLKMFEASWVLWSSILQLWFWPWEMTPRDFPGYSRVFMDAEASQDAVCPWLCGQPGAGREIYTLRIPTISHWMTIPSINQLASHGPLSWMIYCSSGKNGDFAHCQIIRAYSPLSTSEKSILQCFEQFALYIIVYQYVCWLNSPLFFISYINDHKGRIWICEPRHSLAGHPWWPHQGEKAGVGKPKATEFMKGKMETLRNSWEKTKGFLYFFS